MAGELELLPSDEQDGEWCRHPLAYLVEAADDICNVIADLEDGYKYGKKIEYSEVRKILLSISQEGWKNLTLNDNLAAAEKFGPSSAIAYLRAQAIGVLIGQTVDVVKNNMTKIMEGSFKGSLIEQATSKGEYEEMKKLCEGKLFKDEEVLLAEIAGFQVIHYLLEMFTTALRSYERQEKSENKMPSRDKKVFDLLSESTKLSSDDRYGWLLCATDYVSGMTDRFAVDLYRQLSGVTVGLPKH